MKAMVVARYKVARQLDDLQAYKRLFRQYEITAKVFELPAGALVSSNSVRS